ncbi:MAG: HAD-IC family P-type ATPase [Micromonosporaceae bacterium]
MTLSHDLTEEFEAALHSVAGVRWAACNGVLGQVIVNRDADQADLGDLVAVVDDMLGAYSPDEALSDRDTEWLDLIGLSGDAVAAGVGLVGRALRMPPMPIELTALTTLEGLAPQVRKRLASMIGPVPADTVATLGGSVLAAVAQAPLSPMANVALHALRLSETWARRQAWKQAMPALCAEADFARSSSEPPPMRSEPLADGPVEQHTSRTTIGTLLLAGGLLPFPGGLINSARTLVVGAPQAAHHGREAYAAQLGRLLAKRGVVVRDPQALRRLDRLDMVMLDSGVLTTGRMVVGDVVAATGADEIEIRSRVLAMFDPDQPRRAAQRGEWNLAPLSTLDIELSAELAAGLRHTPQGGAAQGRRRALGLTRSGQLVAVATIEPELDPLALALITTARKLGRVLIAGARPELAHRLHSDGVTPGGARLTESVRTAQAEGRGVVLVAAQDDVALAAADCGIGVVRRASRPPWGAHLLAGPDLDTVWLILEAAILARQVSGRSARIAMLGSAAGALLLLTSARSEGGRRGAGSTGVAGLANVVSGVWTAASLGRRTVPMAEHPTQWHALPAEDVLRALESSEEGLSSSDIDGRRSQIIVETDTPGLLSAMVEELDNPLTAPLAAGAGVSAVTGGLVDASLVVAVQAANAVLGAAQRLAATRALRNLLSATSLPARLLRDGKPRQAPADELVPGDIVTLQAGDVVPADCRLLHTSGLEMDESSLTGEALPVAKSPAPTLAAAVADRTSMVYEGTTVAAGVATAVVTATGPFTEVGRSAYAIADRTPAGGVEARLYQLAATSVPVAAGAAAMILGAGLLRGQPATALNSAVALAVAAVPEGLPFVATVAQLSAARRLSRHNVLVRHLRALESLGRVDVVCFDKTGTLTEGKIRLRGVSDGRDQEPASELTDHRRLVVAAALRATPTANGDELPPHPTDRAVLAGGADAGVAADAGATGWRLIRELPFEPGRGFHAVLGDLPEGQLISVKGAPDTVLPRCVAWRHPDDPDRARPITKQDLRQLEAEVDRLASQGLRVLAVAERAASPRRLLDNGRIERLEFRGLLGLADPVRATAADAVDRLHRAGITAVMITGDHPGTAQAIANELGIHSPHGVVTGPELDGLTQPELRELAAKATIFARVNPSHKVAIVRALQQDGGVVAVTGDGANDAPAIRLADIGIALGENATAAAREAADIVVTDDRIETIVHAVVEGRAMWTSVREAVALLLGGNLGEIVFTLGSSLTQSRSVLNARQLLLINLVTDLLPAIAVAARPPRHLTPEDLLHEGPDRSLGGALARGITQRAVATTVAATAGWLAARFTGTPTRASTVALASLVSAQLAQTAVASRGDPLVLAAAGASAAAMVGIIQAPPTSLFFGCRPLGPVAWSIVTGAAATGAILGVLPLPHLPEQALSHLPDLRRLPWMSAYLPVLEGHGSGPDATQPAT